MKDKLKDLGFEDFLGFSLNAIEDRSLVIFIMDHLKVDPLRIAVEGRELPITPHVVKSVLGIPNGPNTLPVVSGIERNITRLSLGVYAMKKEWRNCTMIGNYKNLTPGITVI